MTLTSSSTRISVLKAIVTLCAMQAHKKPFAAVVLSLFLVWPVVAETKTSRTDRDQSGLIGQVQTIVAESGTWVKGTSVLVQATSYDVKGNTTESEIVFYKAESKDNSEKLRTIYERDSSGNRTVAMSFGANGALQEKTLYVSDKSGNQIEQAVHDKEGNIKFKFIHAYDADGNRVETKSYLHDGTLRSKAVYAYDSKRNMTSSSFTDCTSQQDCKLEYTAVNSYNLKGKLTEATIYKADGMLDERRVYTYNANADEQEKTVYNSDGSVREKETYAYEYDSVGNWIKRTITKAVSKDGKLKLEPPYIIKRAITYYK